MKKVTIISMLLIILLLLPACGKNNSAASDTQGERNETATTGDFSGGSDQSKASSDTKRQGHPDYPEYDEYEVNIMKEFFKLDSYAEGETNGDDCYGIDADDPSTWENVEENFEQHDIEMWASDYTGIPLFMWDDSSPKRLKLICLKKNVYLMGHLDLSGFDKLESLYLPAMVTATLPKNADLIELAPGKGQENPDKYLTTEFVDLDLTIYPNLAYLSIHNAEIDKLDFTKNPNLLYFDCTRAKVSSLDLSYMPKLKYFYCRESSMSVLDLSQNPDLETLDCTYNPLVTLDLSANTKLKEVQCIGCQDGDTELTIENVKLPSGFSGSIDLQ